MLSKKETVILSAFSITLISMLAIRDIAGFTYNKFILVAAILSFALFFNSKVLAAATCFMFPLTWGLPYTYIFGGIVFLYWFKRRVICSKALFLFIFFIILELLASLWYSAIYYSEFFKYFSVLAIFFFFIYDNDIPRKECIRFFYYGTIALCAIIIVSTLKNAPTNWLTLFSQGWFRFGNKNAGGVEGMILSTNANTFAYYSLMGTVYAINYLFEEKGKAKAFHFFVLLLFLFSGMLTVSMSWVLLTIICLGIIVVTKLNEAKFVLLFIVGVLFLLGVAQLIYSSAPELFEAFMIREDRSDLGNANSRVLIFFEYNRAFWSNIRFVLMGTGVVQYSDAINLNYSMHNMIQQIFVCYGIMPALVFFAGFLSPLKKYVKTPFVYWVPIVAVLGFTQTIQFINPFSLMLPYVIAYYYLAIHSPQADESNEEVLSHNS